MTPNSKIALILCVLSSTAYARVYAGPFTTNTQAPQVIQQPLSVNPERSEICRGTQAQCPNSLPLAQPQLTSVGILSAFEATGLSQANPNSPPPPLSKTCAQWTWSGSDNEGWTCTAKPTPQPAQTTTPQPVQTTCTLLTQTFYCRFNGQAWGVGEADGQTICFTGGNSAVFQATGQKLTCTSYN